MTWMRRIALFSLLAVLAGVGFGLAVVVTPDNRPGVTKANFDNVQIGMSYEQVQGLLGMNSIEYYGSGSFYSRSKLEAWKADDGAEAQINFLINFRDDKGYKVTRMTWVDSTETLWQRIRRRVGFPT